MNTKRCPTCGRDLPLCDFHADRSRPDGLKWQCQECAREKRQAAKPPPEHLSEEQFRRVWEYDPHRHLVARIAKRYATKRRSLREDFRQEGWLGAWRSPTTEAYDLGKSIQRAIYNAYHRDYRKRIDLDALLDKQEDDATQDGNG